MTRIKHTPGAMRAAITIYHSFAALHQNIPDNCIPRIAEIISDETGGSDLFASLKDATRQLIGAAAWLESSDQKMIAIGIRKWVAETAQPLIRKAESKLS